MFLRKLLTGFRRFSRKHGDISNGALEKSKGALEKSKYNRSPTVIVTLDPNKLAEKKQQCVLIGGQKSFTIRPLLLGQSSHVENMRIHYERTEMVNRPFPDAKAAFLYYSMSPERPRIGGELRIRLTSSGDPASFESGSDLLRSDGLPWSRPLYVLPRYFLPLYEKLREERFVPDDLDSVLLTSPSARLNYNRSHILYTLNDTFIVDFSSHMSSLFVITERGVESVSNRNLFLDQRGMVMRRPYTGSALARLERSTLPDHEGTRTVVLRFLKIITPVKCVIPDYDDLLCCPREGELFQRTLVIDRNNRHVWSINIDKPSMKQRGLRLLWDT